MREFKTKKINCTSIIIIYRVPHNFNMNNISTIIEVYETDKYIGSVNSRIFSDTNLCDNEIELLKNELKSM